MDTWILIFWKKLKQLNTNFAWSLWKWQRRILHFLTSSSENSVVLACGLAGVVYAKKPQEKPEVNNAIITNLFSEVKSKDIKCILSQQDIYVANALEKEIVLSNKKGTFRYKVDPSEQRFWEYQESKRLHQEALEEFLKLKSDKQKSHDKDLLGKQKQQVKQCLHRLEAAWKNGLTELVKELLQKQNAQIVHKKFELYLHGAEQLLIKINELKSPESLYKIFQSPQEQEALEKISEDIKNFSQHQMSLLPDNALDSKDIEIIIQKNNSLLDSAWAIRQEILDVITDVKSLLPLEEQQITPSVFQKCLAVVCVFRGLDKKLETRGRDSCGLSIMLIMEAVIAQKFFEILDKEGVLGQFQQRQTISDLANYSIDTLEDKQRYSITFSYKVAKAIGQLGDNVKQLRAYLQEDPIFCLAVQQQTIYATTMVHTRWASQGIVSIENCHPVDNKGIYLQNSKYVEMVKPSVGNIYAVLNGDIDNHLELREKYEAENRKIPEKITTDAKTIPLTIEHYISEGNNLEQAFLMAVNEFRGSFAIAIHSDIEPGKIYLAQQGKGQGLYVGISPYGYHIASEIYGFVEQTSCYIAMEPGQIFVLDEEAIPGVENIRAMDFHGSPVVLSNENLAHTPITTRDIFLDPREHTHFLEKEIQESPQIIEKTTRGKWKQEKSQFCINLGEEILPKKIKNKLSKKQYRKVLFIGMGTAHAAGEAICAAFTSILGESHSIQFQSVLATEFTATYSKENRQDHLVIAISQSGGTTDTNAAIRKLAEDHADILGIINKRDSDMSFLTDGVLYTGDGRDVEIAVASTKAFYAQVVAGTMYAVAFAQVLGISADFIDVIVRGILELPDKLRELFTHKETIRYSAHQLAPRHVYWDTLSTGIGAPIAKEIKIKLSELCYMSIPEFCAANKKHINLSAEALILCFLGGVDRRHNSSLQKDLQGEISIFLAQKNTPVVFTTTTDQTYNEIIPEERKSELLLKVIPPTSYHFSVIMNTAAGHLWAYYAAKALNTRSLFFSQVLEDITQQEAQLKQKGFKSYNIVRDKKFHQTILDAYKNYTLMLEQGLFSNGYFPQQAVKLEKLFLLATGIIPTSNTALLFGEEWGTDTILNELKNVLYYLKTWLARSIDAIKHQAKYITVGATGFEGISNMPSGSIKEVFQKTLKEKHILAHEDVNEYDMVTLTNIQAGVGNVNGGLLYNVEYDEKDIFLEVIQQSRFGDSTELPSRYDKRTSLRGGRKAITIQGNRIHIGKGHDRNKAIIIPLRALGKITKLLVVHFEPNENLNGKEKIKLLGGLGTNNTKAAMVFNILQENREEIRKYYNFSDGASDEDCLAELLKDISVEELLLLPHEDISEKITSKIFS